MTTHISKLSLKGIKAIPAKNSVKKDEPLKVAIFYGVADNIMTVSTTFGDATRISGYLEAINCETGKIFSSDHMFSAELADILTEAIKASPSNSVEFAMQINAIFSEKGDGYVFEVVPLSEIREFDPLDRVRKEVTSANKKK